MLRRIPFLFSLVLILLLPDFNQPVAAQDDAPLVLLLTAEGALTPSMQGYLERGLQSAENQGAEALILMLDTPGGSVDLMNEIVQVMRASSVPILVYVAPQGAIAGSAGTIITLAGHVAGPGRGAFELWSGLSQGETSGGGEGGF